MPELGLEPDVVIECTGAAPVIAAVLDVTGAYGVGVPGGVSKPGRVAADREWLSGVVRRQVPLSDDADALEPRADDVKTVLLVDQS